MNKFLAHGYSRICLALFVGACMFVQGLFAVHQIVHMRDILDHITPGKVLVVFDIDNTLLMPHTDLGSDQWVSYMIKQYVDTGMDSAAAVDAVLPLYWHVSANIDVVTTEQELSALLQELQQQADHVLCLTARSERLIEKTITSMHENNLNFHIPEFHGIEPKLGLYKDGILFCGNNNKGAVLAEFLDVVGYTPELIIFVDDKAKYVEAVEAAMAQRNIPVIGLRYGGCDHRVRAFDAQATEQHLQDFLLEHPLAL